MKLDEIKSNHIKNIKSLDMKISAITSNKNSSYSEQPTTDLMKLSLLKPTEKSSHASQFTKNVS